MAEAAHSIARVLVIDDEDAARYGMMRALAGQGYELREAGNGREALEVLDEFQPDVLLSDINMPGMDGLTLLRTVRERKDGPLVVLITAYGSEKTAIEALRAGAYDYVAKPYELDELRGAIRNAVERQRLRRELKRSQAALIQSKKMGALAGMVAGVAHEINTPLGALYSTVQTVQGGLARLREAIARGEPSLPDALRLLDTLEEGARHGVEGCRRIRRTVSNLVNFAQLDRADFQVFQLNDCVRCTADLLRPRLPETTRLDLDLGELPPIEGNPRDVNQLVLNLLENAADAIRSAARPGSIRVRTWARGDTAGLELSDDGCGIPEEHLGSIFDPGFTTKGVGVGIGAGLAICHQIVEAHHGSIQAGSRVGEGTSFTVTLPVRQPG